MIGKRIRSLRNEIKLTQQELGKIFGVGKTTISQYESGDRKPDTDMLKDMANFFDTTTDYILGLTDKRERNYGETIAAHRTDDHMEDLPDEAKKSLDEFREYILRKYRQSEE